MATKFSDFGLMFPTSYQVGDFYEVSVTEKQVQVTRKYANGHLNQFVSSVFAPLADVEAAHGLAATWLGQSDRENGGLAWLFQDVARRAEAAQNA